MKRIVILIIVLIVIAGAIYFFSKEPSSSSLEENLETSSEQESQILNASAGSNVYVYASEQESARVVNETKAELALYYFYAEWCPICQEEFPKLVEAMNELSNSSVVAFRVNYNDSETSKADQDLAREHGVAYQHTKVILRGSERVLKSPEAWGKGRYIEEITNLLEE